MIQHTCPNCGAQLDVPDQYAGRTVKCGGCGAATQCPMESGPPAIPVASAKLSASPPPPIQDGSKSQAIACLVLAILAFVCLGIGAVANVLARAREVAERMSCQNNLNQLGMVVKMYCVDKENKNHAFPSISGKPGCLMFDKEEVYPKFLDDPRILVCPSHRTESMGKLKPEQLLDDQSYFYLGYALCGDEDVENFCEVYRQRMAAGQPLDDDIPVPRGKGTNGGEIIYRLQEGVERLMVTDINNPGSANLAQSSMPIFIERPIRHWFRSGGGNVVFMDGHVEYVKYPGFWPMTEKTISALEALDTMGK